MVMRLFYWPLYLVKREKLNFKIASSLETIKYLQNKKISIGRFGDGEFNLMFRHKSIGFQSYSDSLRMDLISKARIGNNNKLMLALPLGLKKTNGLRLKEKAFWWSYTVHNAEMINNFFKNNIIYLNTNFTRGVTELSNSHDAKLIVREVVKLWENRNVLIIEGADTRFGVGNSLLSKANKVYRVLAPAKNSYSKIEIISKKINELAGEIENPLILLALGPTATVLACSLSSDYQVIDIGHFDLKYEEFRYKLGLNSNINSRYNNEKAGGEDVAKVNDTKYESEIKYIIG